MQPLPLPALIWCKVLVHAPESTWTFTLSKALKIAKRSLSSLCTCLKNFDLSFLYVSTTVFLHARWLTVQISRICLSLFLFHYLTDSPHRSTCPLQDLGYQDTLHENWQGIYHNKQVSHLENKWNTNLCLHEMTQFPFYSWEEEYSAWDRWCQFL